MNWQETIDLWGKLWESNQCVAILSGPMFGLPSAHSIPNPDHLGFGFFQSTRNGYVIHFDGGGASTLSTDAEGNLFSWTPVTGDVQDLAEFGFSAAEQRADFQNWYESTIS